MARLTVNLSDDVLGALKEIADRTGVTQTEALRRAIVDTRFLLNEQTAGTKVLLETKDKGTREVVFR